MYQTCMSTFTFLRRACAACVLVSLALLPAVAQAQQKIGFVNPQRVVNETRLGQMAKADLARYVAEKERLAKESAAQVAVLRKEADGVALSASERSKREEAYRRKSRLHESLLQENSRDIKAEEAKLLKYVMRRADSVLEDIGKKGGYALIITDPAAVGFVDKANADLTDRVVRELDSKGK
jgi:outer membrane protein